MPSEFEERNEEVSDSPEATTVVLRLGKGNQRDDVCAHHGGFRLVFGAEALVHRESPEASGAGQGTETCT